MKRYLYRPFKYKSSTGLLEVQKTSVPFVKKERKSLFRIIASAISRTLNSSIQSTETPSQKLSPTTLIVSEAAL